MRHEIFLVKSKGKVLLASFISDFTKMLKKQFLAILRLLSIVSKSYYPLLLKFMLVSSVSSRTYK